MADEDGHEARLAADRKLWSRLEEDRFTGRRWDLVINSLVDVATRQIRHDLHTERIFRHCAKRGWDLRAPSGWAGADQEGTAQETVARALRTFLQRCATGDGWDPQRGSTLHDYFVGLCRGEFANVFRRWLNSRVHTETELAADELHAHEDTADAALAKAILAEIMNTPVLTDLQRKLLFGQAFGFSHDELATQYGISSRAVEGHIRRARRQLRKEGITW